MIDIRLSRILLIGGITGALVIICAALLLASACALVDSILAPPSLPPLEGPQEPSSDAWAVLDEARRITREAAGEQP